MATLDLDGLTGSVHRSLSVKLYDAEGNEVDYSQFSGTMPYVVCQMEVLPTKTVPVDYASAIYGADELAEGYELESVTVLPEETVTLAGEQSVLDGIESVSVAAIDIGGMSESYIAEDIEFLLPEGRGAHGQQQLPPVYQDQRRTDQQNVLRRAHRGAQPRFPACTPGSL